MIQFSDVALRRGTQVLVEGASFAFGAKQKVGLTGSNGTGKSSLLAAILGTLELDQGHIKKPADWVVAHVRQESPNSDAPALEYVLDGDVGLRALQAKITAAEQAGTGELLGELHAEFQAIDGYAAEARAGALLYGLGFSAQEQQNSVKTFSGGWRMRLNLAQALMCRSDLLLLDEPTNHLDLDTVLWLQQWLARYTGTLILISHDRTFLDAVVSHIAHIEHAALTVYSGNYSAFERQRAEKLAQQQQAYEKQQREIAHMQDFVRRFKAKATKAKQAQSRVKMLEKMELIASAHIDSPFRFSFASPHKTPGSLLNLTGAAVAYGDHRVFSGANLSLLAGDRIGLIGANGAGKSSLIKLLAGELAPSAGERLEAKDLRVGYFAQHQLDQLHAESSPFAHLQELNQKALLGFSEQQIYDHLGGFGFSFERINEPVRHFSGGEKARLVLGLLVAEAPNLLLLDEPTNHLDLEMRHALTIALQGFEGALVTVSHDRFLLESVSDQFYLVAGGEVAAFEGDLDDYRRVLNIRADSPATNKPAANSAGDQRQEKHEREAQRTQQKAQKNRLKKLETELDTLSEQAAALDSALADNTIYAEENATRLARLLKDKAEKDAALATVEAEWLALSESLEAS